MNPILKQSFRQRLARRVLALHFAYLLWSGYYDHDGTPLRCRYCDSWHPDDHLWITRDTINGHTSEGELKCKLCGGRMGYWAYGCWEPFYY